MSSYLSSSCLLFVVLTSTISICLTMLFVFTSKRMVLTHVILVIFKYRTNSYLSKYKKMLARNHLKNIYYIYFSIALQLSYELESRCLIAKGKVGFPSQYRIIDHRSTLRVIFQEVCFKGFMPLIFLETLLISFMKFYKLFICHLCTT